MPRSRPRAPPLASSWAAVAGGSGFAPGDPVALDLVRERGGPAAPRLVRLGRRGWGRGLAALLPADAPVRMRLGLQPAEVLRQARRIPEIAQAIDSLAAGGVDPLRDIAPALAPGAALAIGLSPSAKLGALVDYGIFDWRTRSPFESLQLLALAPVADEARLLRALESLARALPKAGGEVRRTSDGWQDLYVTHLDFELNRLYRNNHDGSFEDDTFRSGIGNKAILLSGVSMKFLDYDNDGWPDILQLNGAMLDNVQLYHSEVTYKEPLLMYRNLGKGQFAKVSDSLGADFVRPIAGRGLATSDFDNDGDIDIAVNVRGDYPELLRNDGGNANHWLEVLLIGMKSNRDGIGASLKLTSEGVSHVEQSKGGMSYMSASDPRIHFGLGKRTKIDSLEITWPSGQIDRLTNLAADKIIAVKEGAGIVTHPFPKVTTR